MASQTDTTPYADSKPKKEGFIARRFRFVFSILGWILVALFFNILIELGGIFINYWKLPGAAHSTYMLRQELTWINADFQDVLGSPAENSVRFSNAVYQGLFVWFGHDLAKNLLNLNEVAPVAAYIKAAITIIQLFSVRLVVILFSLPVFFVFSLVAFVDGLMVRDLRRFGGDRESSYIWHYVVNTIKPLVITPFVLYLASPWSIHPNYVVLPFAFALSLAVWLSTAKFKKYM